MEFEAKITIGNLLTVLTVAVSATGLAISWARDRALRRTEYADRIRRAVAITVAKLERREQLAIRIFDNLQPAITDADVQIVETQEIIQVRDSFWRDANGVYANVTQRILDEEVDTAYAELYGYDPTIHQLYSGAVDRLRLLSELTLHAVLERTQAQIMSLHEVEKPFSSAQLGNMLRSSCGGVEARARSLGKSILWAFREQALSIIRASDRDIETRRIHIREAEELFPTPEDLRRLFFDEHGREMGGGNGGRS